MQRLLKREKNSRLRIKCQSEFFCEIPKEPIFIKNPETKLSKLLSKLKLGNLMSEKKADLEVRWKLVGATMKKSPTSN